MLFENEKHILLAFSRSPKSTGFKGPFEGVVEQLWGPPLESQFRPLPVWIANQVDWARYLTCKLFDYDPHFTAWCRRPCVCVCVCVCVYIKQVHLYKTSFKNSAYPYSMWCTHTCLFQSFFNAILFFFKEASFFFFKFIYLFIYVWLCWVFVSVQGLSLVAASGDLSSSRCAGLSLLRPFLLRSTGSRRAG